ncbi:MAG: glycosyltransferase family 2 protein [Terriglobia bacterium]
MPAHRYALIIPALNEAESVGPALAAVPRHLFTQILVVDNGSRDCTVEAARAAGAEVVEEPRRGYGQACQTGLANLRAEITAVAFMDADLSDDPADLAKLIERFERNGFQLIVGSRVLGRPEPGSLTPVQRFGNRLATWLVRKAWGARFTDLGPMRIVRRAALQQLDLHDPDFGWNVEMQAKAARLGLRAGEVPVRYRPRRFGKSKISGTVVGSLRAGLKILLTIYRCWRAPRTASVGAMAGQHRK